MNEKEISDLLKGIILKGEDLARYFIMPIKWLNYKDKGLYHSGNQHFTMKKKGDDYIIMRTFNSNLKRDARIQSHIFWYEILTNKTYKITKQAQDIKQQFKNTIKF